MVSNVGNLITRALCIYKDSLDYIQESTKDAVRQYLPLSNYDYETIRNNPILVMVEGNKLDRALVTLLHMRSSVTEKFKNFKRIKDELETKNPEVLWRDHDEKISDEWWKKLNILKANTFRVQRAKDFVRDTLEYLASIAVKEKAP